MVDIPINVGNAVNLLEAAARQEPMDDVRRRCYASLLYYMGRSDDASRIAQEFLLRGGASAGLYGRTALILAINGKVDSSMQTLESGAKAHPKSARLVFLIGQMHEQSGAGEAARFYRKAVQVDADFAIAHFRLARLLKYARADNAGCFLHCSRVLELEGRQSRLAHEAINLMSQSVEGGPARSIQHLRELSAFRMESPLEANSLSAGLLFHEGKSAEAVKLYRDLTGAGAPRPSLYYRIAEISMEANEWAAAEAVLKKAIREHEDNARLHYLAGELWIRRGDLERATGALREAIALNDDFAPAWHRLASLAAQQRSTAGEIIENCTRVFEVEEVDHPLVKETLPILEAALRAGP